MGAQVVAASSSELKQLISAVQANVSYQFIAQKDAGGLAGPVPLGQGKFAKVYKGRQRSAGRDVRYVAVKVLHDFASYADERLFKQEIELLKDLSSATGVNVVRTLDILHLGPMVMCGCGRVYHPSCPQGCRALLRRKENARDNHPALHCTSCNYELSARFINDRFDELLRAPAKPCCARGATAESGTIINFVDREAIVLELLQGNLLDHLSRRRRELHELCKQWNVDPGTFHRAQRGESLFRRIETWVRELWHADLDELVFEKAVLLEKVRLMVQLTEAVAWLHAEKRIVHKDLAPDNIMVSTPGTESDDGSGVRPLWSRAAAALGANTIPVDRAQLQAMATQIEARTRAAPKLESNKPRFRDAIQEMVSYPRFELRVIDFGLADRDELTRSWYEEEIAGGNIKHPFLSPEARQYRQRIAQPITIEADRLRVPPNLASILLEGDIIADCRDPEHNHDLEVVRIDRAGRNSGHIDVFFKGEPPRNIANQQFEQVRRLGEAHDVYAMGALYYFILTEQQDEVEALSGLVTSLQDVPIALRPRVLARDNRYLKRRNAILEKFWQDELMVLILRAMVRGQPESLAASRITRGSEPAEKLLSEIKRIHYGIQEEILAAPRVALLHRVLVLGGAIGILMFFVMSMILFFCMRR